MSSGKISWPAWAWWVGIVSLVVGLGALGLLAGGSGYAEPIPYNLFREQAKAGNITEITATGDRIEGAFKRPVSYPPSGADGMEITRFETHVPAFGGEGLIEELAARDVTVHVEPVDSYSLWMGSLLGFLSVVLLFGAMAWYVRAGGRAQQERLPDLTGKHARRYTASPRTPGITFAEVAGIDPVKRELAGIVDFLRKPSKYERVGAVIPKGVLLVGPPGTGKTLLAKAVAGEAGVPFFSISASEFVEMFVGVGASRVRKLFEEARREAPAIVFIDEIDAVGRRRGAGAGIGGNDEREQTLNQLLVAMDGFDSHQAVIVLAATNRPDVLDPALLRPGRFDRRVTVPAPDRAGREAILQVHTRGVPLARGLSLSELAAATPGLVGADLRNLVNEAALLAASRGGERVERRDFAEALDKIALGEERRLVLCDRERRMVAYHEAGHALLGLLVPEADPVRKVTIMPRGQALGVTYQVPEFDRYSYTESYLRGRLAGLLGGRAAEMLAFGVATTGAENDLKQATELAYGMVTRWGMSEVGLLYLAGDGGASLSDPTGGQAFGRRYGESLGARVDAQVRCLVEEAYAEAVRVLRRERSRLDALAEALLREETLDEEQIRAVMEMPARDRGRDTQHVAAVPG